MNLSILKTDVKTIRESLQAEKDSPHKLDLSLSVQDMLVGYVDWQRRREEINLQLAGLRVIEEAITGFEQRIEREKSALEAL